MIKILFICHGNICRSPMAEFVLKDMVKNYTESRSFHRFRCHQHGGDRKPRSPGNP